MTIATISVVDLGNPSEVQDWLTANPSAQLVQVAVEGHMFYIFYN